MSNATIRVFTSALAVGVAFVLGATATETARAAESVQCGGIYEVKRGDTLSGLATRVRPQVSYQEIVTFNPGKLSNPNRIDVGLQLRIPCKGGAAPAVDASVGQVVTSLNTSDAVPSATNTRIDILTGSSYAPYVDRSLPHRGFSTHVIDTVMTLPGTGVEHSIDIIDDWSSHLRVLLGRGKYDLAYPWFQPDCSGYEKLGEEGRWRCDNLRFSAPLHEVVVAYYARKGEEAALSETVEIWGKRLCRPRGYFTHDLAVRDLLPPNVNRVEATTPTECFEKLLSGEADVVTVNADTAEASIAELDAGAQVAEIEALATIETLHMVGMRSNDRVRPMLLRFNRGLAQIREDGTWQQIVPVHLN